MSKPTTCLTMSIERDEAEVLKIYFADNGWTASNVLHAALDMFLSADLAAQREHYNRWLRELQKV